MGSIYRSAQGTVAARIQAFQDVDHLENHSAKASRPPQDFSLPHESGVTVGHGRREDSSFGSPAARAPRDGADGLRGDGRPPVGALPQVLRPLMGQEDTYSLSAVPPFSRPATSLATNVNHPNTSRISDENGRKRLDRKRLHSVERLTNPVSELSAVRSKLRPVAEMKQAPIRNTKPRAYTLIDLGNMIDDAIEENTGDTSTTHSAEASVDTSIDSSAIRRWNSARATHSIVDDKHVMGRQTRSRSQHTPIRKEVTTTRKAEDAAFSPHILQASPTKVTATRVQDASPVKQKAALFETMELQLGNVQTQCQAPHERHLHVKTQWSPIPEHLPTKDVDANLHELKFGRSTRPRSGSPLIPLALPQLVDTRPRSRKTSMSSSRDTHESFNTARQPGDVANLTRTGRPESVLKNSKSWPFKWNLFNKGNSILPVETEQVVGAEKRDDHYPPTRPSVVKSRVQDLLAATRKRDNTERTRRLSEVEQLGRRQSVATSRIGELETKEPISQTNFQPTQDGVLQHPFHEENEHRNDEVEMAASISEPKMSKSGAKTAQILTEYSSTEKEVLAGSRNDDPFGTRRTVSPTKTKPNTPSRGRSNSAIPRMTPLHPQYAVEQRFALSPRPSRSQSTSRMKVEVEVRDSPERDARERGDKIVIIRANVEATKESKGDN